MSKVNKKTIVSSVLMAGVNAPFVATYFRVGCVPLKADGNPSLNPDGTPAFPPVKKIEFCRHAFGQGTAVDQPCYTIHFDDCPERVIIPADKFAQITVVVVEDNTTVPALPEE